MNSRHVKLRAVLCFGLLLIINHQAIAASNAPQTSPSHAYQQSNKIIAEIKLLRSHLGVINKPRKPAIQIRKKPIHVYAKSLEVMEKIIHLQIKHGLRAPNLEQIPLRNIHASEVFASTQIILSEITRLKNKLGISKKITTPAFSNAKTSSQVYENLWTASYLLDALTGQIDPSYVFRNSRLVLSEIRQIANKLGAPSNMSAPQTIAGTIPRDVNIQAFKNLYAIGKLQRKLNMSALVVSTFPDGKILPSDVCDSTNNMLAELVRIKVAMGITTPRTAVKLVAGKNPADVLAQMQLININLKNLIIH